VKRALGEEINMNDTDMQIQWQEDSGESVEIGYLNPHGQQCCGHCGVPGTDHGQYAYKTECTDSQKLSAFDLSKSAVGEKQSSIHYGKA
jgi:hypothetical protein